jgi:hypothetical protein
MWIASGETGQEVVTTSEGSTPLAALVVGLARLKARMEDDGFQTSDLRSALLVIRRRRGISLHAAAFLLSMEFGAYRILETQSEDQDLLLHCARQLLEDDRELQRILDRIYNDRIAKEALNG